MKFIVSIHGYDCLDNIIATARVRAYKDYEHSESELVLDSAIILKGEGLDDPRAWLQDVLVGLLELT